MNELLQRIAQFMEQLTQHIDSLTDEEAAEIQNFITQLVPLVQQIGGTQPEQRQDETTLTAPIPVGADLLWILSKGDQNAFVNYLRTFPGQGFEALVSDPNQLAGVIQRLEQQMPAAEPQVAPDGMEDALYQSSNVVAMKYDPRTQRMFVKFHGNNQEPIYQYDGVPEVIFNLVQHGNAFAKTKGQNKWGSWWPMKNPSIGASVNQYLKAGGYPYQRIR